MLKYILEILYPPKCTFCKNLLTTTNKENKYICKTCHQSLPFIFNDISKISDRDIYYKFLNRNYYFKECISVFFYEGIIATSIRKFKFYNKLSFSSLFSYYISLFVNDFYSDVNFDFITYIPMYKLKEKQRGYNQAKLLAKNISKILKIPLSELLIKIKDNQIQHNLPANMRINNVKNIYKALNIQNINEKTILLIDDIVTTGSTLNEASKILKENGAKNIYCATIATPNIKILQN